MKAEPLSESWMNSDWIPFTPSRVSDAFAKADFPWWISGGWAIDLFVGHQTREHGDIDVGILRRDKSAVQRILRDWDLWAADPPGSLRPWRLDETLPEGTHDIWCRERPDGRWRFQLLLNDASGDLWVYRRDPSVKRPLEEVVMHTESGIPYLAPEVQLLFKAGHRSPRDEADLVSALPVLDEVRIDWLEAHLRKLLPGHPWIEMLRAAPSLGAGND